MRITVCQHEGSIVDVMWDAHDYFITKVGHRFSTVDRHIDRRRWGRVVAQVVAVVGDGHVLGVNVDGRRASEGGAGCP